MEQDYSVLMSVYKGEKPEYLNSAINSMINQTIPTNDFVLVCDGPLTFELDSVIEDFYKQYPTLFQIVRIEKNSGLGNALNAGMKVCKNELVARMDSDDIAVVNRCELQLDEFRKDPELALCSGDIAEFKEDINQIECIRSLPTEYKELVIFAKRRNPMNHMAVMYKKSIIDVVGGYIEIHYMEDYYLWVRILKAGYKASNINRILVNARIGNGMYKRRGGILYVKNVCLLQKKMLDLQFISCFDFLINCFVRIVGSIIPEELRKYLYKKKLRKSMQ